MRWYWTASRNSQVTSRSMERKLNLRNSCRCSDFCVLLWKIQSSFGFCTSDGGCLWRFINKNESSSSSSSQDIHTWRYRPMWAYFFGKKKNIEFLRMFFPSSVTFNTHRNNFCVRTIGYKSRWLFPFYHSVKFAFRISTSSEVIANSKNIDIIKMKFIVLVSVKCLIK